MNKCEKCGFLHYRTDPCRKPKESTERKNRPFMNGVVPVAKVERADSAASAKQAVDTNSISAKSEETMLPASQATASTTSAGTVWNEDRQPKFDKKAWMREYMREHRRGLRRRTNTPERNDE